MSKPSPLLRWLALAAIVGNVVYNYVYQQLGLPSMREISDRHANLFTPAPYAFAIWALIYTAFLAFAILGVLPSRRDDRAYDRLAGPLALVNVLAAAWVTMFSFDLVWPCVAVIGAILAAAIVAYRRTDPARPWLRAPFSLLLGWISVATIANVAAALTASGVTGGALGPAPWAIAMIAVAALLAIAIALRYRDPIVPAVVAWAAYAICVADTQATAVATAAVIAAIACLAAAVTSLRPGSPRSSSAARRGRGPSRSSASARS